MTTQTAPQLTVQEVETLEHRQFENPWTAWYTNNIKKWGVGRTEQEAIADMWRYQGLLSDAEATRIAEGRQVWQAASPV